MSAKGLAATAIWTQLLDALKKDFPDLKIPDQTGPETAKVIREIATAVISEGHTGQVAQTPGEFFAYDDNVGFERFNTAEEAKQAAQTSIDEYRHDAGDGWADEVDNLCWGIVLGTTRQIDLGPIDDDGSCGVAGGDKFVDYVLTDVNSQLTERGASKGFVVVPSVPTPEMIKHGRSSVAQLSEHRFLSIWNAALAAAPAND